MNSKKWPIAVAALGLAISSAGAIAQGSTADEIARYRAMLADGNPAELVVARGEELWKTKRGPKNVSLEQCDFGLGAGVLKGAYAQMPRYFADADQVMDFESRLVWCMVTQQGMDRAAVTKSPFSGAGQRQTELEALTAYGVELSRGIPVNVPQGHPKEKASYDRGATRSTCAADRTIFPAPPATASPGNASGCRICPTSLATKRMPIAPTPPGRHTASPRARCARCNGA